MLFCRSLEGVCFSHDCVQDTLHCISKINFIPTTYIHLPVPQVVQPIPHGPLCEKDGQSH